MKRTRRLTGITRPARNDGTIVIRSARLGDEGPLERLAGLDSHPVLQAPMLIAEVDGELRAARSLANGETIADPFQHTAHLRRLLSARAAQMVAPPDRRTRFASRWRRLYARAEA